MAKASYELWVDGRSSGFYGRVMALDTAHRIAKKNNQVKVFKHNNGEISTLVSYYKGRKLK